MNKKNLIILCVIFVALISLVFVKKNMKPQVPTTEEIVDIVQPPISLDSLSEISLRLGDGAEEVKDNSKNVQLAKEDGRWVVKTQYGVRANEKAITPVLEKLDQLKGELRSDKVDLLDDYGISGDKALHVLLQHEEGLIHLVIGTKKAGYQNNFIRFGERNAVYMVNENLLGTLGAREEGEELKLDAGKWSDKRITDLEADTIVGIAIAQTVNGASETVMDIRKNTVDDKKQWQSVKPYAFGLSASKIKSVLEAFNTTYAREIIAPDKPAVFDAPDWIGTFTMENGNEVKLVRGAKDESGENYYAKIDGAAYFYLVPVSAFNSREKQQGDVFATNPLNAEEGNIDEVVIEDLANKKKFHAVKKAPAEAAAVPPVGGDAATTPEQPKTEITWQTPAGEVIDTAKVQEVIAKIKEVNVEAVPGTVAAPKEILTISITGKDGKKEYRVSEAAKLFNEKECHFLKLGGESQDYCVSKDNMTALRNALP